LEYSGGPVCGQHQSVDDHITHHLRFIAEAARQGCDLLVFPELSLTGSGTTTLPPHPATPSWNRCSTRRIVTG
jgi:predicted amidohydrolase